MKHTVRIVLPLLLGLLLLAAGCAAASTPTPTLPGGSTGTTTTTTSTSPTASGNATSTSTAAATFQSLATGGKSTYSQTCSPCHGANGGGNGSFPALWGSNATLGKYQGNTLFGDAGAMLTFISTRMPLNAPGSLSHQQYTELLAYILIQNNLVTPSTAFNESQLSSISIP